MSAYDHVCVGNEIEKETFLCGGVCICMCAKSKKGLCVYCVSMHSHNPTHICR